MLKGENNFPTVKLCRVYRAPWQYYLKVNGKYGYNLGKL